MKDRKRNAIKPLFSMILIVVLFCAFAGSAYACTGVYIGPEASTDGTTILAKSNDYQDNWANHVIVVDRIEDKPGRTMPVNAVGTVSAPVPATTYKYTSTPWMDSTTAYNGLVHDAAVCVNEYGVTMLMAVTAF